MKARRVPWLFLVLLVVGLPFLGRWLRQPGEPGCALDGGKIIPNYRVEMVDGEGESRLFCCLVCARIWLEKQSLPPRSIRVIDEISGASIDARQAWYVRLPVVTNLATGNRIHVFRNQAEAIRQAEIFAGRVLVDSEKPFWDFEISANRESAGK